MRPEPAKEKRHEVERQAKRLERRSENRKLVIVLSEMAIFHQLWN